MAISNYVPHFNVFVVDDSMIVVERLLQMLNAIENVAVCGHATNISSALFLIEKQRPDAVIIDIHLEEDAPEKNGLSLLDTLRQAYPGMILIILTNLTEPQYQHKCMELGANYFFDKTNSFDRIPMVIERLLQSC